MSSKEQPSPSEQIAPSAVHSRAIEILKLFGKPSTSKLDTAIQFSFKLTPHTISTEKIPITEVRDVLIQIFGEEYELCLRSDDDRELVESKKRLTLNVRNQKRSTVQYSIEPDLIKRMPLSEKPSHRRFEISDSVNVFVLDILNKMQEKLASGK